MIIMEFEEMKKIWDSQYQEPLYAINETTLHKRIQQKSTSIKRMVNCFEWGIMGITTFVSIFMVIDAIVDGKGFYPYLSAGIIFLIAVYIFIGRMHRKKQEESFDQSLLGDLNQAISNTNYHITRLRRFIWWYLLPFTAIYALSMYETFSGRPFWVWFLMPAAFVAAYFLFQRDIRKYVLKKQDLEALRNKLSEEEEY